tara:strand:+ start:1251 stop:3956 length:2706 start_codon:yes stop_codon:yes gene_type:complete
MNTDYPTTHFNYNNDFLHQFNLFKKNQLTGIGTNHPTHKLHIQEGTLAFSDQTNIEGNIKFLNKYPNHLNLLEYNINTHIITPLKILNKENSIYASKYEWTLDNNNLMLKFYNKRDNTPIPFHSLEYIIHDDTHQDKYIHFYSKYNIKITHLYIYVKNSTDTIFESHTNYSSSFKITHNNNEYTITNKEPYYYELNSPIILNKNTSNTFELTGISSYPYYVILLGEYIFNEGILWNSNTDNVNIFSKIGIGTSIANEELCIDGTSIIENINTNSRITAGNSNLSFDNSNSENNTNTINSSVNTIYSDKFIINSDNKNVGIGVDYSEDYLNISNDFIINHDNDTFLTSKRTNTKNINIYAPNNTISHKNDPLFIFNNSNNLYNIKSRDIQISKSTKLNTNSNSCITHFLNNININKFVSTDPNTFNNILNVNGSVNIDGNISVTKTIKTIGETTVYIPTNTIQSVQNKSHTHSKKIIYSNYLNTKTLNTKFLTPKKTTLLPDTLCKLVFNPKNNRFYTKNKNYKLYFTTQFEKEKYKFDYNFYSHADLLYTDNTTINTNRINSIKKLILPKKYTYSSTANRINVGNMRFNASSICPEIYNGINWYKLKYDNTSAELNYCAFDDSNLLYPRFQPNIQEYLYHSLVKPLSCTVCLNPNTQVDINFILNNSISFSKTLTASQLKYETFSISSVFYDTLIINSKNLITNKTKIYTFNYNFFDGVKEFLDKYSIVTINRYQNSNNIFEIKPTTTLLNTYYKISKNSIQINSTAPINNNPNNNIEYENVPTSLNIEIVESLLHKNMMQNAYYDRNNKEFHLGGPIKSYKTQIISNNKEIYGGYYASGYLEKTIAPVFEFQLPNITYNFETKKMHISQLPDDSTKEIIYYNNKFGCLFEYINCKIKYKQ